MSRPEELRALVEAMKESEETLRLVEHPAFPDPAHHDEVKRLGRRIGFGALMSTASAGWREVLEERGDPLGGEFVAGPCHSTVVYALRVIRTALTRAESSLASPAGMEGWMPIENYDKERGEVAVLLDWFTYRTDPAKKLNPVRYVGYWSEEYGAWFDDDGMDLDIDPTHFMPLAALPAAPRGESE